MTEPLLDCLRDDLALRRDGGAMLAGIQADGIGVRQGLSEDEQTAVWLFAWAYRPNRRGPESVR